MKGLLCWVFRHKWNLSPEQAKECAVIRYCLRCGETPRSTLHYVQEKLYVSTPAHYAQSKAVKTTIVCRSDGCISCGITSMKSYTIESATKRFVGVEICDKCYPSVTNDPESLSIYLQFKDLT